ncbi:MAG: L,D-transpeptidase [Bacillota bacterium]|jgi:lipoprotein-anchoring transpeptidase ErfK/SrfK
MSRRRVLALTALLFMIAVGGFLAGKVIASSGLPNRLGHGLSGAVETGEPKGSLQSSVQTEDPAEPAGTEQPADPGDSGGRGDSGPGQDKPLYWIDVDVTEQRVRIMEGDEAVKEMIASTGVEGHETPLGTFEIQNRGTWFFSEKYQQGAKYWVSFKDWGIYLFHSLAMDKDQNIIEEEAAKLGQRASHGCVRLQVEDAKWIYDNIPQHTKVVIHE